MMGPHPTHGPILVQPTAMAPGRQLLMHLRTTINSYVNGSDYVDAGLVSLISSRTIIQGDSVGTKVSKTEYFYDTKNSNGTPDGDGGNIAMTCQNGAAAHDDTNYGCASTSP